MALRLASIKPLAGARRSMSAHVWYRAALSQLNEAEQVLVDDARNDTRSSATIISEDSNLFQQTSTTTATNDVDKQQQNVILMVDAPETALGSIPLNEVLADNEQEFKEGMLSWDFAASFLPLPLSEVLNNDTSESNTTTRASQDDKLIYKTMISPTDTDEETSGMSMAVVDAPRNGQTIQRVVR